MTPKQSAFADRRNGIFLCVAAAGLIVLGLVMLASVSVWMEDDGQQYSHLRKQSMWMLVGVVGATTLAMIDYRRFRKWIVPLYGFATLLLILCYVPGIAREIKGESRWIVVPLVGQFQPSEVAKIAIMMGLAAWFAHHQAETRKFWKGFAIPMAILAVPILLIFFEKDMGTAAGLGAAGVALLFIAGTRLRYLIPSCGVALAGFYVLVRMNENRWNRIMAFLDLEEHKLGYGFQQWRALLAFGNGGVEGLGLGNGAEKHGYLPEAHNDFIFPVIGEELGLWFALGVVFCFVMITVYGIAIAVRAPDVFGRLLAIGLTCAIVIPAMMNIGVTTAVLPNTGLPLPFVSYGGTNLVFTMAALGLLVSIHRQSYGGRKEHAKLLAEKKHCIRL
ncbi:cell division protein FtsW [Rubritalea squalenifaciens DSM 18772]|uniref:Probable peptidoglycan glycosyltransferase FtsW n=1 Tax=Rubritalea squalenifaciens DSM 18772 TaxID=1123071 RepID=A0A1M6PEM8_9BACT|nr:putative peptidoglycan glycosyltransferase FtsW [Rubritalea squalenifaciens]SHK06386.1 cell division protein FtsW [Rubritalea squalenifaciens DSM 18772]